jgi:hypothetical protein
MIMSGKVTTHSQAAQRFASAVATSTQDNATPPPSPTAQSAPPPNAPTPRDAPAANGVKTYPIEDPHPGGEPK